jgi:hypothetical protein
LTYFPTHPPTHPPLCPLVHAGWWQEEELKEQVKELEEMVKAVSKGKAVSLRADDDPEAKGAKAHLFTKPPTQAQVCVVACVHLSGVCTLPACRLWEGVWAACWLNMHAVHV